MEPNENEIKALISLLTDDDPEVAGPVQARIRELGDTIIPFLEAEWENAFHPEQQKRMEELIHDLQFQQLKNRLAAWNQSADEPDLLQGMWLIATYMYPDLEFDKLKANIEQIYYEAWLEMRAELHPMDQVRTLNHVLFDKLRFSPNTKNFHSPANSMIHLVLESRKGNPIALCVVYMLVAQKLKMPVFGVNLPNLFILTYKEENGMQFYINAFNKGIVFSRGDIDSYLSSLNLQPRDIFYQPCSHRDIIRRVLRNLMVSFEKNAEPDKLAEVQELLAVLDEENSEGAL